MAKKGDELIPDAGTFHRNLWRIVIIGIVCAIVNSVPVAGGIFGSIVALKLLMAFVASACLLLLLPKLKRLLTK